MIRFWHIKAAIRKALHALQIPMRRLHSYSWEEGDHAHFCYAARLLEPDDFKKVCPASKLGLRYYCELTDLCDDCPYMGGLSFETDESGKKSIVIWK